MVGKQHACLLGVCIFGWLAFLKLVGLFACPCLEQGFGHGSAFTHGVPTAGACLLCSLLFGIVAKQGRSLPACPYSPPACLPGPKRPCLSLLLPSPKVSSPEAAFRQADMPSPDLYHYSKWAVRQGRRGRERQEGLVLCFARAVKTLRHRWATVEAMPLSLANYLCLDNVCAIILCRL